MWLDSTRWICTSSGRSRPPPSGRRWTPCSARRSRAGSAGRGQRRSMGTPRAAATQRGPAAPCCSRRSTPSSRGSAGSASPALNYICKRLAVAPAEAYGVATFYALFATNAAAAGRRPRLRRHRLPAGRRGGDLRRPDAGRRAGRGAGTGRPRRRGCAARALACAIARRPRCSPSPARRRGPSRVAPVDAAGVDRGPRVGRSATGPRSTAPIPPPADRRGSPPGRDRRRRPDLARRLPRPRRLRARSPRRSRWAPSGSSTEVTESRLLGRGGAAFPTGRKWAAVADAGRPAALPRLQRRRIRAGHVQGPRPARGRPVRHRRGDDHRRLRDRRRRRATSTSAASTPTPRRASPTRSAARARPASSGRHPGLGLRLRHRAPARRRRLHLRRGDGALRVDRGQARRAAQQAAVPGRGRPVRQADRRQQRRDAGERPRAS